METAEDYVEAVADIIAKKDQCRVGDLVKHFDVSHVTVSRIVGRLQSEGLMQTEPYRPIELTEKGKRLARKSKQRHEIVFAFLLAIGVGKATAEIELRRNRTSRQPENIGCDETIFGKTKKTGVEIIETGSCELNEIFRGFRCP